MKSPLYTCPSAYLFSVVANVWSSWERRPFSTVVATRTGKAASIRPLKLNVRSEGASTSPECAHPVLAVIFPEAFELMTGCLVDYFPVSFDGTVVELTSVSRK